MTIAALAGWLALLAIVAIAADLLVRTPGRRREDGARTERAPLPAGVDPASLRRRRPLAQRLSGTVLLIAALILFALLRPLLLG